MVDLNVFVQIAMQQMLEEMDRKFLAECIPTPADGVVPEWLSMQLSQSDEINPNGELPAFPIH